MEIENELSHFSNFGPRRRAEGPYALLFFYSLDEGFELPTSLGKGQCGIFSCLAPIKVTAAVNVGVWAHHPPTTSSVLVLPLPS